MADRTLTDRTCASLRHLLDSRRGDELCIYRNQPIILILTHFLGSSRLRISATVLVIMLVPRVVAYALDTTAWSSFDPTVDLVILIGRAPSSGSPDVPMLRDYADIALCFVIAAHVAHIVVQWDRVQRLPGILWSTGLLSHDALGEPEYRRLISDFDKRFNLPVWELMAALLAILMSTILLNIAQHGVYSWLPVHGADDAARAHADAWWANRSVHFGAFAVQYLTYTLFIYLLLRHVAMGFVGMWLVAAAQWRTRASKDPWLGYQSVWDDEVDGVDALRVALSDVFWSMTMTGIVLLLTIWYIPVPRVLDIVVIVLYVLVNPAFVLIPALALNRQLKESWQKLRKLALDDLRRASELVEVRGGDAASRGALAVAEVRLERASALSMAVINWPSVLKGLVIYALPVIALSVSLS